MVAVDGFAVFAKTVVLHRDAARAAAVVELPEARAPRRARVLRADAVLGHRHDADGVGQRPRHRLPVARDPVDRAVRARRVRPPAHDVAGGRAQVLPARLVLVGGVPLRRRARLRRHRHHEPHRHRRLPRDAPRCSTTACCCSASRSCSSASASRSRPRRSTCGRPTCTRARPRRSPRSWRRPRRPPRSPRCCACSSARSRCTASTGARSCSALAVLSLLVGSIAAIVQTDVKRMLAYSSISHAGYVLIAVQAATAEGHERRAVLRAHVRGDDDRRVRRGRAWSPRQGDDEHSLADYRGLARRQPVLAGAVHACSCSRRPACRSPAASWRSSRCSAPRSTSASTCSR